MNDPQLARFAVNLEMWWTSADALDRVQLAADAGFTWVELWYWRNWDVNALARTVNDAGLQIAQFGGWDFEPSLADRSNHDAFETAIAEAVEVADLLDCRLINLNGPYHQADRPVEDERIAVTEALHRVEPIVAEANITLMIEPMNVRVDHPGYAFPNSADMVAVCEAIGSRYIKVNWDFYHLQIAEGDLTGHLLEGFANVAYVQIADHPGRHEPGTGEIRYEFVLEYLNSLGYQGLIGLECKPLESAEAAINRIKSISGNVSS